MADEPTPDPAQASSTQPMPMQGMGKWWLTVLKVVGPGNGVGLLASGVAINSLPAHAPILLPLKIAAGIFLVGVIFYAIAFWCVDVGYAALDHYLQAINEESSQASGTINLDATSHLESGNKIMALAKGLTVIVVGAFCLGSAAALVAVTLL